MFDKFCENCSNKFQPKSKNQRFCSQSCGATFNNKRFIKRRKEGTCKLCKKAVHSWRTYCVPCYEKGEWKKPKEDPEVRKKKISKAITSWRNKLKIKAIEYKGGKCVNCNYSKCNRALTFHHLDPNKKEFTISKKSVAWETMRIELDKCVLLCANCHAEEHDQLKISSQNRI